VTLSIAQLYQMRITIVQGPFYPVPPIRGGAVEKVWFELGRYFAQQGHVVTHISRQCENLATEESPYEGLRYIRVLGCDQPAGALAMKWADWKFTRAVVKVLPEADILVSNTFFLPILVKDRSRGAHYIHVARYPKGQLRFYRQAARLQTVSSAMARIIQKQVPSKSEIVRTIGNWVSLPSLSEVDRNSQDIKPVDILYVGRIHPEKGVHLLLEALARMKNRENSRSFRIVGPWKSESGGGGEDYRKFLMNYIADHDLDVDWLDPIYDRDRLNCVYRRCRLFVYPSLAEKGETFGLAPLEAMSCGVPVVVSSLDCFQDFIFSGYNGAMFDHRAKDPLKELVQTLSVLLSQEGVMHQLGLQARQSAEQFSLQLIAEKYLDDFKQILK
jgi:glycosyltransferase involved in cell wall biosynthesis